LTREHSKKISPFGRISQVAGPWFEDHPLNGDLGPQGISVGFNDGSGLKFLLTDHLGSVVAVTDSSGTLLSEQRYLPFGEVRTVGGTNQTDFGYTGQRNLDAQGNAFSLGLMDYNARFYDPLLGRFVQPDTIVPGAGGSAATNRYAYVLNNSINSIDPTGRIWCRRNLGTGHFSEEDCGDDAIDYGNGGVVWTVEAELEKYHVTLSGSWDDKHKTAIYLGVQSTAEKISTTKGINKYDAFISTYETSESTPMIFTWGNCNECQGGGAYTYSSHDIRFASMAAEWQPDFQLRSRNNVVHELGHAFSAIKSSLPVIKLSNDMKTNGLLTRGYKWNYYGFASASITWQQHPDSSPSEVFADQFLGWVFDNWEMNNGILSIRAQARSEWMNINMSSWINDY
jgi:RHS repeat-associated protein